MQSYQLGTAWCMSTEVFDTFYIRFRRYEATETRLAVPRWAALQKQSWKSMVQTLDVAEQFMTKQISVMSSVLKFHIEYKKSYVGFNQWLHEENQVFGVTLWSNLILLTKKLPCRQSFSFFEHYLISLFYHQLLQIQSWINFSCLDLHKELCLTSLQATRQSTPPVTSTVEVSAATLMEIHVPAP